MHGGVKFYRGSAGAARSYVEADRSRVDDYYLAEGTGLAERYVATPTPEGGRPGGPDGEGGVRAGGTLDGPAYEKWIAGYDVETGAPKGRLRQDARGLRFVEVVVNGPKTWSLVAAVHPEIAAAYDQAQDKAAREIIGWLADHATTRVGPRGRQVQVPAEKLEAAVVRHYTSRAGDPHRHLHLQINARVFASGGWRGLHSVGVVDSIEAINGIGHAAVVCDPGFRMALAVHGYTLNPETGEVAELAPYSGAFSARAAQITRNIDRYEAQWRTEHPEQEPGPALRRVWDRRAWAQARPDKVVPTDGAELGRRWVEELGELGFTPPTPAVDPAVDRSVGQAGDRSLTLLDDDRVEGGLPVPWHLDLDRPDVVGQHRLGSGAVAGVAAPAATRVVLVIAEVVGHLLVQGGLDHRLGQRLQHPTRASHRDPAGPGRADQLPRDRELLGRGLRQISRIGRLARPLHADHSSLGQGRLFEQVLSVRWAHALQCFDHQ